MVYYYSKVLVVAEVVVQAQDQVLVVLVAPVVQVLVVQQCLSLSKSSLVVMSLIWVAFSCEYQNA